MGRSAHTAVCLGYGGDHPQLLVIGGSNDDFEALSDVWLLDLRSGKWREVRTPIMYTRTGVTTYAGQSSC